MAEPPKIVKEIRKSVEQRPPPAPARLDGIDLSEWDLTGEWVELYISHACLGKMLSHCLAHAGEQKEVMGLLLGDIFQWRDRLYTIADDIVAADTEDSTITSVRFGSQGLDEVARALDDFEYDYLIVGWYHSHPGFTPFLSEKDLETQKRNFSKPYHATIVIDPVNRQLRSFKVVEDKYVEKRFILFEQSPMERELTERRKGEMMAYLDELTERRLLGGGEQEAPAPPWDRPSEHPHLPQDVRETIETDIKRIIEEHKKTGKRPKL